MPVIQFPGYTKDPFGGPAGGTQQMFAAMLSSYMKTQEEQKKREQEKLLAELLGGGGTPEQPPGADPTGPAMNMPAPQGGYPMEGPQDYQSRAQAVMSNPALDIRQKIQGLGLLNAQKELEPTARKVDYITINWWDKDGKAQRPYVVPKDSANQVYERLEAAGATWEAAPKESADPELVKYQKIAASMPDGPQKRQIEAYIAKMIRTPSGDGEGSNTPEDLKAKGRIQVGESWYSPAELRGFWKDEYKLIDQDDPAYWQLTPEQQRAMDERVQQAPKLSDFVNQARRQGYIPGTGPIAPEIDKSIVPGEMKSSRTEEAAGETPPPPPKNVKNPEQFKQLMATPEGKALRRAGWPGNRQPTAAEVAKARALIQSKQVR